jgi:hypothetical protein
MAADSASLFWIGDFRTSHSLNPVHQGSSWLCSADSRRLYLILAIFIASARPIYRAAATLFPVFFKRTSDVVRGFDMFFQLLHHLHTRKCF